MGPRAIGVIGILGVGVGLAVAWLGLAPAPREVAARNDRYGDYVIATGQVALHPRSLTDGVWLLDYRAGKLLGTVIDRNLGRIVGWAEVDLVSEFQIPPQQQPHFLMTTGTITEGQAALYVAEVGSGRFGVYTMGPGLNGQGIVIRRHDMVSFRPQAPPPAVPVPGSNPGVPVAPVEEPPPVPQRAPEAQQTAAPQRSAAPVPPPVDMPPPPPPLPNKRP